MVKKGLSNKQTRRKTLGKKYKIKKKVKEHKKKVDKAAKKSGNDLKVKDWKIPTNVPFKEEIVEEMKETRGQMDMLEKKRLLNLFKAKKLQKKANSSNLPPANQKKKKVASANLNGDCVSSSRIFELLSKAHILLEVVDARSPLGTRASILPSLIRQSAEQSTATPTNQLLHIVLLNKIDLVPAQNLADWLAYFRNNLGVLAVPFKCETVKPSKKLSSVEQRIFAKALSNTKSKRNYKCLGQDVLLELFFARLQQLQQQEGGERIKVVVAGAPNTGKSSVITSLLRCAKSRSVDSATSISALNISSAPNSTKKPFSFSMGEKVELFDSIALLPAAAASARDGDADGNAAAGDGEKEEVEAFSSCMATTMHTLANCMRVEEASQPRRIAKMLFLNFSAEQLQFVYSLPAVFSAANDEEKDEDEDEERFLAFISALAEQKGKKRRGGQPDFTQTCRALLRDWQESKVMHCSKPPQSIRTTATKETNLHNFAGKDAAGDANILQELRAFEVKGLNKPSEVDENAIRASLTRELERERELQEEEDMEEDEDLQEMEFEDDDDEEGESDSDDEDDDDAC